MPYAFAQRVGGMGGSAIREILKITERPDIISFAGGLPAPEMFPRTGLAEAFAQVLREEDGLALQYSSTEGYGPLREYIAGVMRQKGVAVTAEEILITSGSQQGLDLVAKLFLDPGDVVATELPVYTGALQVFRSYEGRLKAIPGDEHGPDPVALEIVIRESRPKLIYLAPTFNNPTGMTVSEARRRALVVLCEKYAVPLIEDDPYGDLRYSGIPVPPVKAFDAGGRVIYLGTFSKTVAPGLRLGWVAAERELVARLALAKQGADLHTGTLVQRALHRYLTGSDSGGHVEAIRREYGRRRDAMAGALNGTFPPGIQWNEPEGGMFFWVTLPAHLDAAELLPEAVAEKVAFVPGAAFFPAGGGENFLRLNFTNSPPPLIGEGIGRLARVLARHWSG
ncbi:MAG TPA: PLP-dependent aminotransferase family protein [Spirochaetia bacterium]|nr:PLP-dependent aminotransferase family protein [Spirochaetia bacterium]